MSISPSSSQGILVVRYQTMKILQQLINHLNLFNEAQFPYDLAAHIELFNNIMPNSDINVDCKNWFVAIIRVLDQPIPIKTQRVKSKILPDWVTVTQGI